MEPLQAAIAKIAGLPDLAPETRTLQDLAAQAQAIGKMPKIPVLAALPAAPCPDGWADRPATHNTCNATAILKAARPAIITAAN